MEGKFDYRARAEARRPVRTEMMAVTFIERLLSKVSCVL
jgi:hypothetical protein